MKEQKFSIKSQRGITLIALVITIILLIILATVSIKLVQNGNIFAHTEKAAAYTEIRQIQEQLEIKKVELAMANSGLAPSSYSLTINDLDLSDNIKQKYSPKLVISSDGILYYVPENVTQKEIQYFEDMGIFAQVTGSTFRIATINTKNGLTPTSTGYYNLVTLKNSMKQQYNTAPAFILGYDMYMGTAEPSESEFLAISDTLKDEISLILCNEDEILKVDSKGNVTDYNGLFLPMNELEANKLFGFDIETDGEARVKVYKGSEAEVHIPSVLYDDNGNVTREVTKILSGAFEKSSVETPKVSFLTMLGNISEDEYDDMYISEMFTALDFGTYEGTDSKDRRDKLKAIFSMFTEETTMLTYDDSLIPMLYMGDDGPTRPTVTTGITKIIVNTDVLQVDDNAFKDQTSLVEATFAIGEKPTIGNNAFSGCTSIANINFRTSKDNNWVKSIDGYASKWGAPATAKVNIFWDYNDANDYTEVQ